MARQQDWVHGGRRWICVLAPWLVLGGLLQLVLHQEHYYHSVVKQVGNSQQEILKLIDQQQEQEQQQRDSLGDLDSGPDSNVYFLAAVIFNRVFQADKFNITGDECRQWIEYMLNAGVDHIFWYDTAHHESESQEAALRGYVDSGALTYHRFYSIFPFLEGSDFHYEQDNSYAHFIGHYNQSVNWAVEMDVDEYPFSESDTNPGFLARYLRGIEEKTPLVSQILLQCMMFMGNPVGEGWVIERYQRRKKETEGKVPGFHSRHKPIFKPRYCEGVTSYDPHKFSMRNGSTVVAAAGEIRMNHYWGPRLTDFGPDTPEVLQMLVLDRSIQQIASQLKNKMKTRKMMKKNRIQQQQQSAMAARPRLD